MWSKILKNQVVPNCPKLFDFFVIPPPLKKGWVEIPLGQNENNQTARNGVKIYRQLLWRKI